MDFSLLHLISHTQLILFTFKNRASLLKDPIFTHIIQQIICINVVKLYVSSTI